MGFFSNLLSAAAPALVGALLPGSTSGGTTAVTAPAATAAAPIASTVFLPPGPTGGGLPMRTTGGQQIGRPRRPGVRGFVGAGADPVLAARAGAILRGGRAATVGGLAGNGEVFTQTVVQRVSRADGEVISERVMAGSPFLMNSEVRSLRRVSKMITKAHGKVPKRGAKVSQKMIEAAVTARLNQLNLAQCVAQSGKC